MRERSWVTKGRKSWHCL